MLQNKATAKRAKTRNSKTNHSVAVKVIVRLTFIPPPNSSKLLSISDFGRMM